MADDIVAFGRAGRADPDTAVEDLFRNRYPGLVRTAYCLVGDWALAEQLVQDAYLRLWRRWRWIRDPDAAPAYLHRCVVNGCRQSLRRRTVERRVLNAPAAATPEPEQADAAAIMALRQALAELPARKRACVVLRYLADMTEAETARVLGVSVGTVKSQTHKGLIQLRERLAEPPESAELPTTLNGTGAAS